MACYVFGKDPINMNMERTVYAEGQKWKLSMFFYDKDGKVKSVENGEVSKFTYTYNKEKKLIYAEDHTGWKISLRYQMENFAGLSIPAAVPIFRITMRMENLIGLTL